MSISQILSIATVVFAVYAGMSCLCSWINERIAAFLALRGWNLFRGIANLLGADALAAKVVNHPLIAANSAKPERLVSENTISNAWARFYNVVASRPPSYVDARNFSNALWQVLPDHAGAQRPPANPAPAQGNGGSDTVGLAQTLVQTPSALFTAMKVAVDNLPLGSALQKQLQSLLDEADGNYSKLLDATDAWFNAEMDRVSGWYARQTQWIVIAIALIVVTVSGVDTMEMVRTLSIANPSQLSAIADSIEASECKPDAAPPPPAQRCASAPKPSSISPTPSPAAAPSLTNGPTEAAPFDVTQFAHIQFEPKNWFGLSNWFWTSSTKGGLQYHRGLGMLLTWLALALGGPFWFNVLCSIANIRAAGNKPSVGS
jgi:hypothetical protein